MLYSSQNEVSTAKSNNMSQSAMYHISAILTRAIFLMTSQKS